jgi:NagD protein
VIAGIESGMQTILVLSGITREREISRFPYQPQQILPSVAEIEIT